MANTTLPARRPALRAKGRGAGRQLSLPRQILLQLFCLFVAITVLFPITWIVSLSLDATNNARPTTLRLIPEDASLNAYRKVIEKPTSNNVTFAELTKNSFMLASGVAAFSVLIGVTAAYAFSRLQFTGRKFIFTSIGFILLMPQIATIAPLFVMLDRIQLSFTTMELIYLIGGAALGLGSLAMLVMRLLNDELRWTTVLLVAIALVIAGMMIHSGLTYPEPRVNARTGVVETFSLRRSLYGVGFAMISGALPFSIWNLKGYLDTIPKELEEAAIIDGASPNQIFFRIILPLATPALAVTGFLGFMQGWTEFGLSWAFLTDEKNYTLSMTLYNMTGQYSGSIPWSNFAAMALLVSLPVSIVYLFLQKYIVGGLTLGGVKG